MRTQVNEVVIGAPVIVPEPVIDVEQGKGKPAAGRAGDDNNGKEQS